MDIATLVGTIVGFVMVIFGIMWGKGASVLQTFIDVPSIIITVGEYIFENLVINSSFFPLLFVA